MKHFRFRFSILSLLAFTAVIAVGAMLYQRHLAWKDTQVRYRALIREGSRSKEVIREIKQMVIDHPQLAKERGSLEWSVLHGDADSCFVLLAKGADPEQVGNLYAMPPLHLALFRERIDHYQLLLEFGADIRSLGKLAVEGNTLLHQAAAVNRLKECRFLLAEGLPVNAANAMGITPLRVAMYKGHIEMMKLLLEHGASDQLDNQGRTLRDVVEWRREYNEISHLDMAPIEEMTRMLDEYFPDDAKTPQAPTP